MQNIFSNGKTAYWKGSLDQLDWIRSAQESLGSFWKTTMVWMLCCLFNSVSAVNAAIRVPVLFTEVRTVTQITERVLQVGKWCKYSPARVQAECQIPEIRKLEEHFQRYRLNIIQLAWRLRVTCISFLGLIPPQIQLPASWKALACSTWSPHWEQVLRKGLKPELC